MTTIVLLLAACGAAPAPTGAPGGAPVERAPAVRESDVVGLKAAMEEGSVVLVDVRSPASTRRATSPAPSTCPSTGSRRTRPCSRATSPRRSG